MELKVLVAESSKQVRKNITRSLKEMGVATVVEAASTEQAIEMFQKGTYDVIFAEWNTQIGVGEELLKTFRKMDVNVPIIVTAPQSKNVAELKKNCPSASSYLTTPFTTEQLRTTVAQYVPSIAG